MTAAELPDDDQAPPTTLDDLFVLLDELVAEVVEMGRAVHLLTELAVRRAHPSNLHRWEVKWTDN